MVFRDIYVSTLEHYRVVFLYEDSTNGEVGGIRLDFEWHGVVWKNKDGVLRDCLL